MDGEQALSLFLGTMVVALELGLFAQASPGPGRRVLAVSYALTGVFFALWPPQTCLWLDHTTGIAGLGVLVWACATTLSLGLQVTFHGLLNERWPWWVRATPALVVGTVSLYMALWVLVRLDAGQASTHLLYDGYRGTPPAVLAWNLWLGISIASVSGVAAYAQLQDKSANGDTKTLGYICIAGVLYGTLIAAQALAAHLGYGATAVVPVLHLMRLVAVVLATGCAAWSVVGADLWAVGNLWWRTRYLNQQWDRLTFLLVVLSDRLVWRYAPDATHSLAQLVRRHARRSHASRTAGRHILIALQAARRISWRRGVLVAAAWDDAPPKDRALTERSIAAEAAHDIATGSAPVSDIGHVVLLILAHVSLPAWLTDPLPGPTPDHIAAAALLAPYFGVASSVPALPKSKTPSSVQRAAGLPVSAHRDSVGQWIRLWYQMLAKQHAQAEMNLMVCCELIEDYLLQMDAPDDVELAVHVWSLGQARRLSPFQTEVAQRASQILALFGPGAVKGRSFIRVTIPPWVRGWCTWRARQSPADTKVTRWCATATIIETVLETTYIPADAMTRRGRLDRDRSIVAGLIREAAHSVRRAERL